MGPGKPNRRSVVTAIVLVGLAVAALAGWRYFTDREKAEVEPDFAAP